MARRTSEDFRLTSNIHSRVQAESASIEAKSKNPDVKKFEQLLLYKIFCFWSFIRPLAFSTEIIVQSPSDH